MDEITVHGKSLEGNLSGDSPDREVMVYLPPSYERDSNRRYPVLYMLHGFTDSAAKWFGKEDHWINLPELLDKALAAGGTKEMIVVMPNAFTRFEGSMYSSSRTTGNWEEYISDELVRYIDDHYRTIPEVSSRGLAGHSMGGYGAMRIGMRHPDVFSGIYLLSPCCMGPRGGGAPDADRLARIEAVKTDEDIAKADFGTKAMFAAAAAWSPNPRNPPFYLDLPFEDGEVRRDILAKYAANAPLAMVDQYIGSLKSLEAIAMDAGDKDRGIAATVTELDDVLNSYGVEHAYEIYDGDHVNRIGERIETNVIPFFSKNLSFAPER